MVTETKTDLLIIGGGPGGYHAAFRAASHGIQTTLVEKESSLGGVCLHRGCIPSKTYLSLAESIHQATDCAAKGVTFGPPKLDIDAIRSWKCRVVEELATGVDKRCRQLKINRLRGAARFEDGRHVVVTGEDAGRIEFRHAIIATGSRSIELRGVQIDSPRVLTSRTALDFEDVPSSLLVIGGGYIGLELGQMYAGFGSRVSVVEMLPTIAAGADKDVVRPLLTRLKKQFDQICVETKVVSMTEVDGGIKVGFEGRNIPENDTFEKVLVSVGRRPNSWDIGLDRAGVDVDPRGFVAVNEYFETSAEDIYAIGDVIGNPMLAHKAMHEGLVLADRLAGEQAHFGRRSIPAVVFTDPEVAWAGVTQQEAKEQGLPVITKKIPWGAAGRAVALGRVDGVTKLIFHADTKRLIGVGMAGVHVGEMISEAVLAIEVGATAGDLASAIHPHPTLSETICDAANLMFE